MLRLPTLLLLLLLVSPHAARSQAPDASTEAELRDKIDKLVLELNAQQAAVRDAAEKQLTELSGGSRERGDLVLELLPQATDQMPAAVRARLDRVRLAIDAALAEASVEVTRVSLDVTDAPFSEVLASIVQQTGNPVVDYRDQFGQEVEDRKITIKVVDEPFWQALDRVLDEAGMSVYGYAGEDSLALVNRDDGEAMRVGRATYAGPFRIEPVALFGSQNLRSPDQNGLRLDVEVAWEPRLQPIAVSQPASDLVVIGEGGVTISPREPDGSVDIETMTGSQSVEMNLPLVLPGRGVEKIDSIKGKLRALTPGRNVEFEFDDLATLVEPVGKSRGGVNVTLERVRKNGAIWEVHMRMKLDNAGEALASHRGWVFQNPSYLKGADGEPIENVGFETTLQTPDEIGVAYLFDLPGGLDGLTWVYKSPAAIVNVGIDYELKDIPLP